MRKDLAEDFDEIYVLDLGGNVRKNPKLSGTTHNVFGIQVGVSINLFVRHPKTKAAQRPAAIRYHTVGRDWRKEQKYEFLENKVDVIRREVAEARSGRQRQLAYQRHRRGI